MKIIYTMTLLMILIASCNEHSPAIDHKSQDPVERLKKGNQRFLEGKFLNDRSPNLLNKLSKGQHPYAVVVSCSDSRISPNVLFDTDLGDLFIIRTAGNIIGEVDLASVEYAVEHLDTRLIVVLGHSSCGAIGAFMSQEKAHGHIQTIIDSLKNEVEEQQLIQNKDKNPEHYERCNVTHQARYLINNSDIIKTKVNNKSLRIVEAFLNTKNGKIDFK